MQKIFSSSRKILFFLKRKTQLIEQKKDILDLDKLYFYDENNVQMTSMGQNINGNILFFDKIYWVYQRKANKE